MTLYLYVNNLHTLLSALFGRLSSFKVVLCQLKTMFLE
ncbi:hypothetical protein HMPREF1228_1412 [Streptococcus pyogenes GA41345]|nr:hypothetical protein HMPREF1228_1412 [Streptococcus pyogenes GA41345]